MDDTLRINGVVAPEASLPFVARNAAPTGDAKLLLDSNNQAGVAELKVLAGGNCELNAQFQFISFNTTNRLANLAIEPNIGGSNDGEVIFGYGFVNLSASRTGASRRTSGPSRKRSSSRPSTPWNRSSSTALRAARTKSASSPRTCRPAGPWARLCKTKSLSGKELMCLDYQKLSVVLWGVVKRLQKRVEKLEKHKRRSDDSD